MSMNNNDDGFGVVDCAYELIEYKLYGSGRRWYAFCSQNMNLVIFGDSKDDLVNKIKKSANTINGKNAMYGIPSRVAVSFVAASAREVIEAGYEL